MPENSTRVYATQTIRIVKRARTPARYAYEWLTDYRTDDGRLSESRPKYQVLRMAKDRVVRIRVSKAKGSTPPIAIELIRLHPPNAWHVDQIDEQDLAAVDYKVTPIDRTNSRIELRIIERWMSPKYPSRKEYQESTGVYWDRIVDAMEKRYRSGKPAIG